MVATTKISSLEDLSKFSFRKKLGKISYAVPFFGVRWFNEDTWKERKNYNGIQELRHAGIGALLLVSPFYEATGIFLAYKFLQ